jgi:hypothetical protein
MLSDHYCSQHFYSQLSSGLPAAPPFSCASCAFSSKTQLALVRHVGAKHGQLQKLLSDGGLPLIDSYQFRDSQSRYVIQHLALFQVYQAMT